MSLRLSQPEHACCAFDLTKALPALLDRVPHRLPTDLMKLTSYYLFSARGAGKSETAGLKSRYPHCAEAEFPVSAVSHRV